MTSVIPIASGKGGVGKTLISSNLGYQLAKSGKTVILVDLDLGASNLHTMLGIKNHNPGIGDLLTRSEKKLENLILPTSHQKLYLIPGDTLIPGAANPNYFILQKIIRSLRKLTADFVLLDLGAGSHSSVVDLFLTNSAGIMVLIPEPTSVLNAYSFIKTAVYRMLLRSFKARSEERNTIQAYMSQKMEGTERSIDDLIEILAKENPQIGDELRNKLSGFYPRIIINQIKDQSELNIGARLRQITMKNLQINMQYIGVLPYDQQVSRSIIQRKLYAETQPESLFIQSLQNIANQIIQQGPTPEIQLYEGNEDLIDVVSDFQG
jgi:flagellar biosynthesis protein FlhG